MHQRWVAGQYLLLGGAAWDFETLRYVVLFVAELLNDRLSGRAEWLDRVEEVHALPDLAVVLSPDRPGHLAGARLGVDASPQRKPSFCVHQTNVPRRQALPLLL